MGESVFKPGDRCGSYRVVRLLATGGMGEVYQATHDFIERDVALKTVRAPLADRAEFHNRLKTEAKLLGRIQHPNVVTVYDAGLTNEGIIYIAMQLLQGQTLREALRGAGRIPVPQALQVGASIAEGLEAAHEIGVVHRDVKPENVFITDHNALKILDLGTAKLLQASLRTSVSDKVAGTLWYMAPEQILVNSASPRSDVYALGLMLFEMIVGRHAFAPDDGSAPQKFEIGLRQLYSEPPSLTQVVPGLPDYVGQLVAKAIRKDPEQRFGSMLEFATAMRVARKQLVEDARAQGSVVGYLDLSKPIAGGASAAASALTTTVDSEPPMRTVPLEDVQRQLQSTELANKRTVRLPPNYTATSAYGGAPASASSAGAHAPAVAASATGGHFVQIEPRRSEPPPDPPIHAAQTPEATRADGASSGPAQTRASLPSLSLDDIGQMKQDFDAGMRVLGVLPLGQAVYDGWKIIRDTRERDLQLRLICATALAPHMDHQYRSTVALATVQVAFGTQQEQVAARARVEELLAQHAPYTLTVRTSSTPAPDAKPTRAEPLRPLRRPGSAEAEESRDSFSAVPVQPMVLGPSGTPSGHTPAPVVTPVGGAAAPIQTAPASPAAKRKQRPRLRAKWIYVGALAAGTVLGGIGAALLLPMLSSRVPAAENTSSSGTKPAARGPAAEEPRAQTGEADRSWSVGSVEPTSPPELAPPPQPSAPVAENPRSADQSVAPSRAQAPKPAAAAVSDSAAAAAPKRPAGGAAPAATQPSRVASKPAATAATPGTATKKPTPKSTKQRDETPYLLPGMPGSGL